MARRRWPSSGEEWRDYDADGEHPNPNPDVTETAVRETARFESVDGEPLIRLTDKRLIPFGFQPAKGRR